MTPKTISPSDERIQTAWRAAERLTQMIPSLQKLASSITGRRMEVRIGLESQTFGDTIEIAPPFKLGLNIKHDPLRCNRYSFTGRSLCEACAIHEGVLANLYHEIGHHLGGTFAKDRNGKVAGQHAIQEPFLAAYENIIEDVRCNWSIAKQRPGAQRIIAITTAEGLNDRDYSELDLGTQLMLVSLADAEDTNLGDNWQAVAPQIKALRELPEYWEHVNSWVDAKDVWHSLVLGREFIAFAQKHGFYMTKQQFEELQEQTPPPPPPAKTPEPTPGLNNTPPESNQSEENNDDVQATPQDQPGASDEPDEAAAPGSDEEHWSSNQHDQAEEPSEDGEVGDGEERAGDADDSNAGDEPQDKEGASSDEPSSEGEVQPQDAGGDGGAGGDDDSSDLGDEGEPDQAGDLQDSTDAVSGGSDDADGERSSEGSSDATDGAEGDASEEQDGGDASGTGSLAVSSTGDPSDDTPDPGAPYGDGTPDALDGPTGPQDGTPDGDPGDPEPAPELSPDDLPAKTYEEYLDENGKPEDVAQAAGEVIGHDPTGHGDTHAPESKREVDAIQTAVKQFEFFDTASKDVAGVRVNQFKDSWGTGRPAAFEQRMCSDLDQAKPSTGVITQNVTRLKYAFAENDRSAKEVNRKSGKVNARTLGKRAPLGDQRLFFKKTQPKKRDYAAVIAVDVTGSTSGDTLHDIKVSVVAMAEMLNRLGIPFEIHAHTARDEGIPQSGGRYTYETNLNMFNVKTAKQKWGPEVQRALGSLYSSGFNLDGHALEYVRKRAEILAKTATDVLVIYYSDGGMFSNDSDEQAIIWKRNVEILKRKRMGLTAVGVGNDDPKRIGIDMVRYDGVTDIPAVVEHIAKQLDGH